MIILQAKNLYTLLNKKKRILFVSHDASLSGAPVLLLHLLKLIREQNKYDFDIVIGRGGVLENEFSKIRNTIVLKEAGYSQYSLGLKWLQSRVRKFLNTQKLKNKIHQYEIIFGNSILSGLPIKEINKQLPVVCYVHELESVINKYFEAGYSQASLYESKSIAYPGTVVREILIEKFNIPNEKLFRLNYYISAFTTLKSSSTSLKKIFGIGLASERKGTDVFIKIAKLVRAKYPDISFFWIGDFENETAKNNFENLNSGTINFLGPIANEKMNDYFSQMDLLLLTSREDPYPVVVLEAASAGNPTLAWAGSGGIVEFLANECGFVCKDYTTQSFFNEIEKLISEPSLLAKNGSNANEKFKRLHQNKALVMQQFEEIVESLK